MAFDGAVAVVECAVAMQRGVARHNAHAPGRRLQVRVGPHVGEPIRDEDDYFGTPVVVAKRLRDAADGGQILASDLVCGLVGRRGGMHFDPVDGSFYEPSAISDFEGTVAVAQILASGVGTDTRTGLTYPMDFDLDMRIMEGRYRRRRGDPPRRLRVHMNGSLPGAPVGARSGAGP